MIFIAYALQIYSLILIARAVLTWFPQVDRKNQIVQFIFKATEPVLEPVRRVLPTFNGIDFSVMVVLVLISVVVRILWSI
jgi:YggT family protein